MRFLFLTHSWFIMSGVRKIWKPDFSQRRYCLQGKSVKSEETYHIIFQRIWCSSCPEKSLMQPFFWFCLLIMSLATVIRWGGGGGGVGWGWSFCRLNQVRKLYIQPPLTRIGNTLLERSFTADCDNLVNCRTLGYQFVFATVEVNQATTIHGYYAFCTEIL